MDITLNSLITSEHVLFTITLLIMMGIFGFITLHKGYPDGFKALLIDLLTSSIMSAGLMFIMLTVKPDMSMYSPILGIDIMFVLMSAFIIQRSDYYDVIIPKHYYVYQVLNVLLSVLINVLIIHYDASITDKKQAYIETIIACVIVIIAAYVLNKVIINYVAMSLFMFAPVLHFKVILMLIGIMISNILLEAFIKLVVKAAGFYDLHDNEKNKNDDDYKHRIINGEQKIKSLSESSACIAIVIMMLAWFM